jgi:putative RNA 2'-phosphotransferase
MADALVSLSKFCSLVLRHQPEKIGLVLDANGWADVSQLVTQARQHGVSLTAPLLEQIVSQNSKNRFEFSEDHLRIRARQGHSVDVDLELSVVQPPQLLYHGTATRFVESIRSKGLIPGSRQHVHLSADAETARMVGQRHGKPVVLTVEAQAMAQSGHTFHLSSNGVWLTTNVPAQFIQFTAA